MAAFLHTTRGRANRRRGNAQPRSTARSGKPDLPDIVVFDEGVAFRRSFQKLNPADFVGRALAR